MDKSKLMRLLKKPLKQTDVEEQIPEVSPAQPFAELERLIILGIVGLLLLTLLIWVVSKRRAEDLSKALTPQQLQGLSFHEQEFNPSAKVYVSVQEGQIRNPWATNLGGILPIISRDKFKTFTNKDYETIGAAPWGLTTNFEANLQDPELMQYLLSNQTMIQAFLTRPDVEPLLADPQMLLAFTEDDAAMREFFEDAVVKDVLANEKMVRAVAGSRFMGHLLTSRSVKYFRDHPQEAAAAIRRNPYLAQVQQNPYVQAAVKENPYLKTIASALLQRETRPRQTTTTQAKKNVQSNKTKRRGRSKK